MPVIFRDRDGNVRDIDYFVVPNDKKYLICDEKWF